MTWRTVVVKSKSRLSYKNDYLIIRNEKLNLIHLSEISTLLIDSTAVSITSYLISELMKRKIKVIFCDEKRNPQSELIPYYGAHNSSQTIMKQINWTLYTQKIWTRIIKEKICNQSKLLYSLDNKNYQKLIKYSEELQLMDSTNREGHAAKVYFNSLFGMEFSREESNDINASLNYGYSILLSQFNKSIVNYGYLTQIGIKHSNYFNNFNLSSDLMEPFRPLIDKIVKNTEKVYFDTSMKLSLLEVLDNKIIIKNKEQYVSNAINIYVKSVFNAIENENTELIEFYSYEF